jgi:hypothetical protein
MEYVVMIWITLISISFIPVGFLTCHNISQHGTDGFTLSATEGLLQIFIALGRV